jgi:hypothetical protein
MNTLDTATQVVEPEPPFPSPPDNFAKTCEEIALNRLRLRYLDRQHPGSGIELEGDKDEDWGCYYPDEEGEKEKRDRLLKGWLTSQRGKMYLEQLERQAASQNPPATERPQPKLGNDYRAGGARVEPAGAEFVDVYQEFAGPPFPLGHLAANDL